MRRRAASFRQADVTRAMRGAIKAGATVRRVVIDPDGKIAVICAEATEPANPDAGLERLMRARGWEE